jgi:hypothetical protein
LLCITIDMMRFAISQNTFMREFEATLDSRP